MVDPILMPLVFFGYMGLMFGFIIFWKFVIKPYLKIKKALRKRKKEQSKQWAR